MIPDGSRRALRPRACAVLLLALVSGCGQRVHRFEWPIMGTYLRVTIAGEPSARAKEAAQEAFAVVARVDSLLSIYKPESEFSRLNRAAGVETLTVSLQTMEVLEASRRFYEMTEGAFDPSVGPLMRLWKLQGEGRVPSPAEIDSVRALVGFSKVFLEPRRRRVFLPEGMRLDSGGIGKGYAADLAREALRRRGIRQGMVDLGGNLALLGGGPGRRGWSIGIRNPLERDRIIGVLEITDGAVATSGQYEQYVVKDGKRLGHILDPREGKPAEGMLSATIIAPDATTTDGLSTGVFVLGPERGLSLVERIPGVEAVIVTDPGGVPLTRRHVLLSSGLRDRIRWDIR